MSIDDLEREYGEIKDSDDVSKYIEFVKHLLALTDSEAIEYHFNLLQREQDTKLRNHIRAGFVKRGTSAERYLLARMKTDKDSSLGVDILHILGRLRSGEAKRFAREFAAHRDPAHRRTAAYVLGWMADSSELPILQELLINDPDPTVRRDAATAHDQIMIRLPELRQRLVDSLGAALQNEKDDEVAAWVVITLQYILKKRFGLKENIDEATWSGDLARAKAKAIQAVKTARGS